MPSSFHATSQLWSKPDTFMGVEIQVAAFPSEIRSQLIATIQMCVVYHHHQSPGEILAFELQLHLLEA